MLLFFFQAEVGIRDLVRSRGLGDVYKRQVVDRRREVILVNGFNVYPREIELIIDDMPGVAEAVSYTNLPLPTSDLA